MVTVFYDGACPICSREVNWLAARTNDNDVELVDISREVPEEKLPRGYCQADLHGQMHAVAADGRVLKGMEVVRELYRLAGLGWMMKPTGWPIIKPIADAGYRLFARNRHRIGKLLPSTKGGGCEKCGD